MTTAMAESIKPQTITGISDTGLSLCELAACCSSLARRAKFNARHNVQQQSTGLVGKIVPYDYSASRLPYTGDTLTCLLRKVSCPIRQTQKHSTVSQSLLQLIHAKEHSTLDINHGPNQANIQTSVQERLHKIAQNSEHIV